MRVLTSVILVGASIALAACGSSGPKRLSKEEYARRADAICTRYQQRIGALATPHDLSQIGPLAAHTAVALGDALDSVRTLRPPTEEDQLVRRWLVRLATLRADALRIRRRAEANDLAGLKRVGAAARADDRAFARLSTLLGMHVCSANAG